MMNLYAEIMNIPLSSEAIRTEVGFPRDYRLGHLHARHAAAEIAFKAEARIEELQNILSKLMDKARDTLCSSQFDELDEYLENMLRNKQ